MSSPTELQSASARLKEAADDLLNGFDHQESALEAADIFYALEVVLGDFEAIIAKVAAHQRLGESSLWDAERVAALQRALLAAAQGADQFAHRLKYE